jgi:holliday junction DNA helicase RuvA
MIGHLTGKIISKKPTQIILDVNGVGYVLNISITTFEKLPELNESVSLFTYLSVREDALDLFGFSTQSEKEMFELLKSVSGIGPKLALSVLSGLPVQELKEALRESNISRIIAIPGIGRKTAERLLIELRDKVDKITRDTDVPDKGVSSARSDAVVALTTLGYNQKTAEKAVRDVMTASPDLPLEEIIKNALSLLNK